MFGIFPVMAEMHYVVSSISFSAMKTWTRTERPSPPVIPYAPTKGTCSMMSSEFYFALFTTMEHVCMIVADLGTHVHGARGGRRRTS